MINNSENLTSGSCSLLSLSYPADSLKIYHIDIDIYLVWAFLINLQFSKLGDKGSIVHILSDPSFRKQEQKKHDRIPFAEKFQFMVTIYSQNTFGKKSVITFHAFCSILLHLYQTRWFLWITILFHKKSVEVRLKCPIDKDTHNIFRIYRQHEGNTL